MEGSPFGLFFAVNISCFHPLEQLSRLNIHKLYVIGLIKHGVGDPFLHLDAGDRSDHIVQALDMLHVDGRVHVDPGLEQLLHILMPFHVPAARRVGVRELIDKDELGHASERLIDIEF